MKPYLAIGISVIILIIGLIVYQSSLDSENQSSQNSNSDIDDEIPPEIQQLEELMQNKIEFDFEAHDLVRLYKGSDNQGQSIVDILNERMFENYPNINEILNHPHRVEWYNYVDTEKGENFVVVGYAFETFKEQSEYIWQVDKNTNQITAKNELAQKLLDHVNTEN